MTERVSRLQASRKRLKSAVELTRRELETETGLLALGGRSTSRRLVVPMIAGAAGLALALTVKRFFRGTARRRGGEE